MGAGSPVASGSAVSGTACPTSIIISMSPSPRGVLGRRYHHNYLKGCGGAIGRVGLQKSGQEGVAGDSTDEELVLGGG